MKKLIAECPIQYLGRTYGPEDILPAHDGRMVAAWLRAGTAVWSGTEAERAAQLSENIQHVNNALAVGVLNAIGVQITDKDGAFVGAAQLAERIMAVVREHAKEGEEDQGTGEADLVTGRLDAKQMERMTKAELLDMAAKLGVDLSGTTNNAQRVALIAAVAQAPAQENGGAQ